jgi:lysophospholipase L1-like esterase
MCSLLISFASRAQSDQPYLMAAMGDSISAGFLADTTLGWFNAVPAPSSESPFVLLASLLQDAKTKTPWDSLQTLETRYELSWTTGRWMNSHFRMLTNYLAQNEPGSSLAVVNFAKTGGLTSDVVDQAGQIVQTMQSGQYKSLKYVTLLIGDNDSCLGTADSAMTQNLLTAFEKISQIQQAEPIRILVSGMPRIPDLGRSDLLKAHTIFDISCSVMRLDLVKECVSLTDWKTNDQYQQSLNVVQDKNQLMANLVNQVNTLYPNLQVVFSNSLFGKSLEISDLAIDCFHPNANSQAWAAQTLWADQPWFH